MNTHPELANDHRFIPAIGMTGAELHAQMRAEEEEFRANMPPVPPCPTWCTLEPGHVYEYGSEYTRFHYSDERAKTATVMQEERNDHGVVSLCPLVVEHMTEEGTVDITAAQARMAAAELLNAADLIDQIQAATA